ncbi:MAG: hypothetical protein IT366_22700 [Candidatus Hydrogenedentes bacterium]|nr:hypothetical protein [Candidatus Hydrogenedentota bacterium]
MRCQQLFRLLECFVAVAVIAAILPIGCSSLHREPSHAVAQSILDDTRLHDVVGRAKKMVATGFTAGEGYGEVWIRDLTTFMELACDVYPAATVKERLLVFFHFQGENGNIVDGYIPKAQASVSYKFIYSDSALDFAAHKNTVETDQESSLVLGVCRYAVATGDFAIFNEVIDGETVSARLARALTYVHTLRFSEEYGLVWGATTADWGDVQPEHGWGVEFDQNSHRAIDIYDNALYLQAIDEFIRTAPNLSSKDKEEWRATHRTIAANVRKHLWDASREKFIPHLYLDGSPFPADFDENQIYYHGGTAVAIEAGILSEAEVKHALDRMVENVRAAGASSIGLTMYPPYPAGYFKNPGMAKPYSYQNGGDWTWFGARMIRQLVRYGYTEEAYRELMPMVQRVIDNDGFHEWYALDNSPRGSGQYRGAAGVLYAAIRDLRAWAEHETKQ